MTTRGLLRFGLVALLFGFGSTATWSQSSGRDATIDFDVTLDEATWISLDVSPDGKTLVFDILGDVYTLPIAGGEAKRITSGDAYDVQPRFSPDGQRIAFVSDRGGGSNVWSIAVDGSDARALGRDGRATFSSPEWTHDGSAIVVSRQENADASSSFELWQIDAAGAASRLKPQHKDALGAAVSSDGRWVYFSRADAEFGASIERFDRTTGTSEPVVRGYGGAVRPAASPDGRWLAFGRRFDNEERLVLRDLRTGAQDVLDVSLDFDQQGNPLRDLDQLPGYAFMPDSSAIVYAAHGKIHRYDLRTRTATVIPFRAHFQQAIPRPLRIRQKIDQGPVQLKLLRWLHESPDGKTLFFSAAGKNYRHEIATGRTRAIGDGPRLEYSPAVSPDGRWLAYVSWSDRDAGHIYKTSTSRDQPVRLTTTAGHYEHLAWSADSRMLMFLQSSGGELRGEGNLEESVAKSLRWMNAARPGPTHLITHVTSRGDRRQEMRPSFDRSGTRVWFSRTPAKRRPTLLCSIGLDGADERCPLEFAHADDILPSPDGKWVAFTEQFEVHLAAMPDGATTSPTKLGSTSPSVKRLSEEGGYFVNWLRDGKGLSWSWGPEYFRTTLERAGQPAQRVSVSVSESRAVAGGSVLLRGARIISMDQVGVVEHGDILIENGRITALGESGDVAYPRSATVIDMTGKTIMPGIIDTHSHYRAGRNPEIFPENDWGYVIQLAYGVTTLRDPSARSQSVFTQAEMVETGRSIGPRIFSSGQPIYFADTAFSRPPVSLGDTREQVRRLKKLGATSIKQYSLPRRDQRQWAVQAAREVQLPVIPEGSQKIAFDMTLLMDGYTTLEHSIKTKELYKDIRSLIEATGTYYVPTLIVGPDGSAADYWYQHTDTYRDQKMLRFTPSDVRASAARVRTLRPDDDFYFKSLSLDTARILHEGGNVVLGSHGDVLGPGAHWELWSLAMGGMSPLDALRTATILAAAAMGLQDDIGSLAAGKVADLIVLDRNPLDDIRNSDSVRYVMKDGTLWAADTMDQVWPQSQKFPGFYWQRHAPPVQQKDSR